MNKIEQFWDAENGMEGLFAEPACRQLEPNFTHALSLAVRSESGEYLVHGTYVAAQEETRVVTGLSYWIPDGSYEQSGLVIVKNPHRSELVGSTYKFGVRNAILLDGDSGVVFAGRVAGDRISVLRPVTREYQDHFRATFENLSSKETIPLLKAAS